MNTNILVLADQLSDQELLAGLQRLAGSERAATAEVVAHLAALDTRAMVYAAEGYGSLFAYCTQALGLSEDAACNRIEAARACRRFPLIIDLLLSGAITVTAVRLLGKHLTVANHESVLARASRRSLRQIEALVAELTPQPDLVSTVRRLPAPLMPAPADKTIQATRPAEAVQATPPAEAERPTTAIAAPSAAPPVSGHRPVVRASAPERYRVQFTVGQDTHDKLRRLQALLRREIPDGDPAAIFDRALTLLLAKVEKAKLAATDKPRTVPPIRRATDSTPADTARRSRHIPAEVTRTVWRRDARQCAFETADGRRCTERAFLERHHVQAHAKRGPATVANIALHCWRHNQYEAERIFGPRRTPPEPLVTTGPHPPRAEG